MESWNYKILSVNSDAVTVKVTHKIKGQFTETAIILIDSFCRLDSKSFCKLTGFNNTQFPTNDGVFFTLLDKQLKEIGKLLICS